MEIQEGFKIKIDELPNELDTSLYMWYAIYLYYWYQNKSFIHKIYNKTI